MPITPQEALLRCIEHREIFHDEMLHLFRQIMSGEMSPTMVAALTMGLRVKKETIGEITAAAQVMREFSTKVPMADTTNLLDIVGTGGDGANTFNISSASMFVAAAAGARIAKHGGRSVSSSSGSADVIEALGAHIDLKPEQIAQSIAQTGIGFMFAPNHHAAMKFAAPVRREMGVRTIFNILGPLTNPAGARQQVMGVFHPDLVGIQARVLQRLGSRRVIIVHGLEGLDELSISGPTMVGELKDGEIREYTVAPEDFGLPRSPEGAIRGAEPADNAAVFAKVLAGEPHPARDAFVLNAAGALVVARGLAPRAAALLAREVLENGAALRLLDAWRAAALAERSPS